MKTFAQINRELGHIKMGDMNPLEGIMGQIDEHLDEDAFDSKTFTEALDICQIVKDEIYEARLKKVYGEKSARESDVSVRGISLATFIKQRIEKQTESSKSKTNTLAASEGSIGKVESTNEAEDDLKAKAAREKMEAEECIKFETMVNSCLVQRLCEEEKFEALS